ncbi:MAG: aspartate aminotransferase family protein [Candidatus Marinimicrobia bacterium]|nr:aspartate aminotransferase family protein [Candidatus Neomarinimicrobiota bacterium]|tara:strand:+ start:51424 stop:52803 length:1380 start_codon:yes stop_codon:yes gene_type:complete
MSNYKFLRTPIKVPKVQTKHRLINSSIPAPGTDERIKVLEQYESRSMQGQIPIIWDKADDFNIYDKHGNKWIDFTSTIFVANVGHGNKNVCNAVKQVLEKPLIHSYAYVNEDRIQYHKKLVEFAGPSFEKAFLLSAGTEATEAALKLMRMNGKKNKKRKYGIICIEGNWHGRTMGAQMMSGNPSQKDWIGYHDPNIYHIRFPYPWVLNEKSGAEFLNSEIQELKNSGIDLKKDICGVMLETFQGWGAVFYPIDFVQAFEKICKQYKILLAFDEMQSGFARTGKKFGYEHYKVHADLLCCGKGIASGFPLSAVIGNAEIMDLPEVGNMSSTHSANPFVCAAGMETLNEIERLNLVRETDRKGLIFHQRLDELRKKYPEHISFVLGKGLLAALIFKLPDSNRPDVLLPSIISEKAMQKGLLVVHTGRESIKLAPPLTITDDALKEGIEVLDDSISEAVNNK